MADNHKIKNIYYMLAYAYQSLRETGINDVATEDFDNIHDLFAAIIACGIGRQIKMGLHRDYILQREALAGLRGQVEISESIKRQSIIQGRLICNYHEFSEDSAHNQILKATMLMLLRHGEVRPKNKTALKKLLLYFNNTSDVAPSAIRWNGLKYHRNNVSYRMLIGICRLAIKGLLLTTEAGVQKLASWLQDEAMHRLYEKFVLAYYQRHHSHFAPKSALIKWDLQDDGEAEYLPTMKADIMLSCGDRRLIIDTKYYSHAMQENYRYARKTFISNNLYQIFTYVKNSDQAKTGNVAGIILYAKTDEEVIPNHDCNIGGNRISLKTLDLNREWPAITEQLDCLCGWLNDSN